MFKFGVLFGFVFVVTGCATISPQAANVVVHTQMSNFLDDCERLGNVSASVSAWSKWDWQQTIKQAENDVREKAWREYRADSVAIVNVDVFHTSSTVQGIAFRCNQ